jgi:chitinase
MTQWTAQSGNTNQEWTITPYGGSSGGSGIPTGSVIGYFDNWGTTQIQNFPSVYNVICYAFAEGSGTDGASIYMYPPSGTNPLSSAASNIATAKSQGKLVLLSIGGGSSPNITLENSSDVNTFVSSVENLVSTYGFNGIDLDLENSSVTVNSGDNVNSPTTTDIVEMGQALTTLKNHFGSSFLITYAPETADIDAYGTYGGEWGSYLALISATRSVLSMVDIQCYDSGSMYAANGSIVAENTVAFEQDMADLLCNGYTISGGQWFNSMPASQVSIGNEVGQESTSVAVSAYNNLKGEHGSFGGVMVWDMNTDVADGSAWANALSGAGLH